MRVGGGSTQGFALPVCTHTRASRNACWQGGHACAALHPGGLHGSATRAAQGRHVRAGLPHSRHAATALYHCPGSTLPMGCRGMQLANTHSAYPTYAAYRARSHTYPHPQTNPQHLSVHVVRAPTRPRHASRLRRRAACGSARAPAAAVAPPRHRHRATQSSRLCIGQGTGRLRTRHAPVAPGLVNGDGRGSAGHGAAAASCCCSRGGRGRAAAGLPIPLPAS